MSHPTARNDTLARTIIRQICLFAALAMIAQFASTVWRYAEVGHMADHLLQNEVADLSEGLFTRNGRPAFKLPADLQARYGDGRNGYSARVSTPSGEVLFASCDPGCMSKRLPVEPQAALSSLRLLEKDFPVSVSGARSVQVAGQTVSIAVAITRDPDGRFWWVLVEELVEEMILPSAITVVFALGATVFAIRRALAPVKAAAAQAERFDPSKPYQRIETTGMPQEIAKFAGAMDRAYVRVRELMTAQKVFSAAIAHEVRTPLSIVRLELEAIDHPRARTAMNEIDDLVAFMEQLTALARLETAARPPFKAIDLDGLLRDIVIGMAPWVYDRGATLTLGKRSGSVVFGDESLLGGAVKNLIENAVKHGGSGVAVVVNSEPGPRISVVDSGELHHSDQQADFEAMRKDGGLGIGLEIVRRIAALHEAALEIARLQPSGVRSVLRFNSSAASV